VIQGYGIRLLGASKLSAQALARKCIGPIKNISL